MPWKRPRSSTAPTTGSELVTKLFDRLDVRFILPTVVVLTIAWAAFGLNAAIEFRTAMHQRTDAHARAACDIVATSCIEAMLVEDYAALDSMLEAITSRSGQLLRARIVRSDGTVVAESRSLDEGRGDDRLERRPIRVEDDEGMTIGQVEILVSDAETDALVRQRIIVLILESLGTLLLVAAWIMWRMRGTITRPLRKVTEEAVRLGDGDLETPISRGGKGDNR